MFWEQLNKFGQDIKPIGLKALESWPGSENLNKILGKKKGSIKDEPDFQFFFYQGTADL